MSYRPSCHAVLTVPMLGSSSEKDRQIRGTDAINVPIRIVSFDLEKNDHLTADSLNISAEYNDLNMDPRYLKNATIQFWAGQADDSGVFIPDGNNLRFVGVLKHAKRKTIEDGLVMDMEFHDYTSLFLAQKPYPSNGIPTYNSTLSEAWQRICDHTGFWDVDTGKMVSNVEALKDALVFRGGIDGSRRISDGVPKRLADYGKLSIKHGDSAWDVWQRCVFSLGLISFIDKDKVIVTTSTEYFAASDAPRLIYGQNILECDEVVDTNISNRGIGLVSYDVTTGKTIEAFYPLPGDVRINIKRNIAKKIDKGKVSPGMVQADQYDVYEYHEVTDPDILTQVAKRAYEERSRQEIQGYVRTAEMFLYTADNVPVDIMDLGAGDNIEIRIDPDLRELVKNVDNPKQHLIDIGYDPDVAAVLIRNLDALPDMEPVFHTRNVNIRLDPEDFEVTIKYWNKIRIGGGQGNTEPNPAT